MDEEFCCLGVLCDLYPTNEVDKWRGMKGLFDNNVYYCYGSALGSLPNNVKVWSGLDLTDYEDELVKLNDMYMRSFKEIADYIERVL